MWMRFLVAGSELLAIRGLCRPVIVSASAGYSPGVADIDLPATKAWNACAVSCACVHAFGPLSACVSGYALWPSPFSSSGQGSTMK
jgi:hypothetical protein